jgi:hypothetical protein
MKHEYPDKTREQALTSRYKIYIINYALAGM